MSLCIHCGSVAQFHEKHKPLATYCNEFCQKQSYGIGNNVKRVCKGNLVCDVFTEVGTFRIDNNKPHSLFLGQRPDRRKEANEIVDHDIKTVISVTDTPTAVAEVLIMDRNGIVLRNFGIKDARPTDFEETRLIFEGVAKEITRGLKRGNVLVHCYYGRSRSPAFLVYWLIKNHVFTSIEEARDFVADNRSCVRPVDDWVFIKFLRWSLEPK